MGPTYTKNHKLSICANAETSAMVLAIIPKKKCRERPSCRSPVSDSVKSKDQPSNFHVIARRAKPDVAIPLIFEISYGPRDCHGPAALAMTWLFWLVLLVWMGSYPTWSAGAMPPALQFVSGDSLQKGPPLSGRPSCLGIIVELFQSDQFSLTRVLVKAQSSITSASVRSTFSRAEQP